MEETNHGNRDDTEEWLKLKLGTSVSESSLKSKRVIRSKSYPCAYCTKFTSPQALGGHQNGHKKERELQLTTRMCTPHCSDGRSLPVYTHSSVRWTDMEYHVSERKVVVTGGTNPLMLDESASVRWTRSFNDLNLRL